MLYDGSTFEHKGREFTVTFPREDGQDAPWDWCDGHGPVSDWTTRDKLPGERVLHSDRSSKRYYDIAEATRIAKRDGWGLGKEEEAKLAQRLGRRPTQKQIIAEAVERDFDYLRGWCSDDWTYVTVLVEHESGETESLGMIESSESAYLEETAHELADEICHRLDAEMAADIAASPTALALDARPGL
jgi:hypothetical protein